MQNLWKTYDDITGILWKRKIRSKWRHSGNPLSEAVIGRIFLAKITDNQSDDLLRMLSKNGLPFSYKNLRKSYLADLQNYENCTTNMGKILRSFENRAPDPYWILIFVIQQNMNKRLLQ